MPDEPPRPQRPRSREPQWFALTGLALGLVGVVSRRAGGPLLTFTETVVDLLRRSLPGLLAVGIGVAIWALGSGWPTRAVGLALRALIATATAGATLVGDALIVAVRNVQLEGRPTMNPPRWELPFRLTLAGFALGTLAALLVDLIRRLMTSEEP